MDSYELFKKIIGLVVFLITATSGSYLSYKGIQDRDSEIWVSGALLLVATIGVGAWLIS